MFPQKSPKPRRPSDGKDFFHTADAESRAPESGESAGSQAAEIAALEAQLRKAQAELERLRRRNAGTNGGEASFRSSFEKAAVGLAYVSLEGTYLQVNEKLCGLLGSSERQLLGSNVWEKTAPEDRGQCEEALRALLGGATSTTSIEKRHSRCNGEIVWLNIVATLRRGEDRGDSYFVFVVEDITRRKAAEEELARINRALKMLSACNEALIRAEHEQELLQKICDIVVEIGGYRMAWVGVAQHDEALTVLPKAFAGAENGYLSAVKLTWDEHSASGQGPVGTAIRTGRFAVGEDFQSCPEMAPWQVEAKKRGFHLTACLPLCKDGVSFGVLGLYSAEQKLTSGEELKLLRDLANDLAFGVVNLRGRAEQRRLQNVVVKVAASISASTGEEFFIQLARNMADVLGAEGGFVTRKLRDEPGMAQTLAAVIDGEVVENFSYPIAGTPCEKMADCETWVIAKQVATCLSHCPALLGRQLHGYVGQRLEDGRGEWRGHLSVVFRDPLENVELITTTLQIFAARAAAELERQEADQTARKQAALLDIAHEAIYAEDLSGRVIYWNKGAERTYGWSAAEVLGRESAGILRCSPASLEAAREALMRDGEWQGETVKFTKDGSEKVVEVGWTLVREADGTPRSVLAIDTDITARKRAEEELSRARENSRAELEERVAQRTQDLVAARHEAERANRAKSEFLSRMSHELRTPLHAILGFAQLLEQEDRSVVDAYSISQIARAGGHLLMLINEVLDIARVEAGKLEIVLEPVNVRGTILEAFSLVKTQAAERGVTLQPLDPAVNGEVMANAQRLRQILMNLFSNAVKFNRPGGLVSITSTRSGDCLRLSVTDTGRGIAPEKHARLFIPFDRLEVDDAVAEGAGLGLSITKHLVEAMGGSIGVQSALGKGATFWFELPLSLRHFPMEGVQILDSRMEESGGSAEAPVKRCTVLCVEDNLASLRLVERIIARRPAVKLLSATGAVTGLELARRHLPDLVLIDLHLPDLKGDELLEQLQADAKTRSIPVVIISANVPAAQIERLKAKGAKEYLGKPLHMGSLLAIIDSLGLDVHGNLPSGDPS